LELRKEAEAAEARGVPAKAEPKTRKARKAPAKRTSRSKVKAPQRKRIVWVIYSGSMKEEGRFPYDQRAAAEERMEVLRSKSKKLYFLQPVKEIIGEGAAAHAPEAGEQAKPKRTRAAKAAAVEEDDVDQEQEEEEEPEEDEDEE
jgi:hypothetical protein